MKNVDCEYCANFNLAVEKILKALKNKYAVLILGAGNIDEIAYKVSEILHK